MPLVYRALVVWQLLLNASTLIGGLAGLHYLYGAFMLPPTSISPQKRTTKRRTRRDALTGWVVLMLQAFPMSARVGLGLQWIITIYIFGHLSRGMPLMGILMPLWLVPLALAVHHLVVSDEAIARIVGGILGGMIGAAIAYAMIDRATPYGLSTGIFFGTLVSGHVSNPVRRTSLFSLIVSTLLLLFAMGVFDAHRFFGELDGRAFIDSSLAVVFWLVAAGIVRMLAILRISHQDRQ